MSDPCPSLLRDGLQLRYAVEGVGAPGALFAHGLTGTGRADWRRMLPVLAPTRRCVVPDLRGHGRSDYRDDAFRFDAMVADLLALIAHEHLDRPHLVGFSMGAELVLALELRHPGTARSLTLIGASTGCPPDRGGFARTIADPPEWPQSLQRLHDGHHGPEHWRRLFRGIAHTWDERPEWPPERLRQVECPVLIVQGEGETPYKHRQAQAFVGAARDARLEIVPGADHPVHIQQPERVNALVHDFLRDVDASVATHARSNG